MIRIVTILLLCSVLNAETLIKDDGGFTMTKKSTHPTGFEYSGRIIWGDPAPEGIKVGDPYVNGLVFVSEGKTRAWEYVGKTDSNGTFSLPIKPYTQFKLYGWDGTDTLLAKYDGHFYYNSELDNLYMTPTGGEPYISPKGDIIIKE